MSDLRKIIREELNELFGRNKKSDELYRFVKDKTDRWALMAQEKTDDQDERTRFLSELVTSIREKYKPVCTPQFSNEEIKAAVVKAFKVAHLK